MDIKITDSSLRRFLETQASTAEITEKVSLCGPTFDRIHQVDNDTIFEIEAITNRIDTASSQGVAREAAIILEQFNIPAKMINDPYLEKIDLYSKYPSKIHFEVNPTLLVKRFVAISLENIIVKDSPKQTQDFLNNCGQRPINNIVDITNELTLLYGLPSHIFDYDKLALQKLIIRESKNGETITTLDDQKNTLKGGDIVIEDGSGRLVDLCGIMGGHIAQVDEHTKNILLIVPVYEPKRIRQSSLYLQKRTLAAQIYEKQPDPVLCLPVITKAIQLFKERAGGLVSSSLYDFYPTPYSPKSIFIDLNWLNRFVGIDFDKKKVINILTGLGFESNEKQEGVLECLIPSWRYPDINIKEDLAEEIARVYGYFRLPSVLPNVHLPAEAQSTLLTTELKIKKYLSHIGFHEIFNSSLVSADLIEKTNLDPANHIKLVNSLSSDYEYLRTSLVPSGLQNHRNNQGKINKTIRTFEVSNCYLQQANSQLPAEISNLVMVSELDYSQTKGELENLLRHLNLNNISFVIPATTPPYFLENQTANIISGDLVLGHIGFIHPTVLRKFDLVSNPVVVEIDITKLINNIHPGYLYKPVSEYPQNIEVITLSSDQLVGDILQKIKVFDPLIQEVTYKESYQNKHTFKVAFGSMERNLDQKEVNLVKEKLLASFDL